MPNTEPEDRARVMRARRAAENQSLSLVKFREGTRRHADLGPYALADATTHAIKFSKLSLEDVENHLHHITQENITS